MNESKLAAVTNRLKNHVCFVETAGRSGLQLSDSSRASLIAQKAKLEDKLKVGLSRVGWEDRTLVWGVCGVLLCRFTLRTRRKKHTRGATFKGVRRTCSPVKR